MVRSCGDRATASLPASPARRGSHSRLGQARMVALLIGLAAAACGSPESSSSTSAPQSDAGADAGVVCAAGTHVLDDGSCEPAGLPPDAACQPGEMPLAEGGCELAGIPEADCGEGFAPTGERGCEPILPDEPCASGLMALPGDLECAEIAACGASPWGNIPLEPTTQYVDGSYLGGDSDGTASKPWLTITEAVQAAPAGGQIAVAAGSYGEDVVLEDKAVRLWGRCPQLVEVVGSATAEAAIFVKTGADGSELRQLGITGGRSGVLIAASEGLLVDALWIHDTARRGLDAENAFGPLELRVTRTLIERATSAGVVLLGLDATLEGIEVRDTLPGIEAPVYGQGMGIQASPYDGTRASVTVVGSVLSSNRDRHVGVLGSDVVFERCVVRDTLPREDGLLGRGFELYPTLDGERANLTIRSSVVEGNYEHGIFAVGADLTIEQSVVRDTRSTGALQSSAIGIGVYPPSVIPLDLSPTTATIRSSVVEQNALAGILVSSSVLQLDATIVRDTRPADFDGTIGRAVALQDFEGCDVRSTGTVRWSVLERSHEVGFSVIGSDVTLESSIVRDTAPQQSDLMLGRGINVQVNPETGERANLTIHGSLVEGNREVGVAVIGSDVTIEQSLIRETQARALDDRAGRAIHTQLEPVTGERSVLALRGVAIEDSREVAVAIAGTDATIEWSRVSTTAPQDSDGFGGDALVVQALGASSTASIEGSLLESSHRAGIASFGAKVLLGSSQLECNAFHLNGEVWDGQPFDFDDLGGNVCGCDGEAVVCMLMSADLEPPAPL